MPDVLVTWTMPHVSLLPADEDQASFVFTSEDASALALATALHGANIVGKFYGNDHTNPGLYSWISGSVSRGADVITERYYDLSGHLDGSDHGAPVLVATNSLGAPATAGQSPNEVAAVLTIHDNGWATAPVSIPNPTPPPLTLRPKQSHAGRMYFGPLTSAAIAVSGSEAFLAANLMLALKEAAQHLLTDVAALTVPTFWSVWSRKLAALGPVVGGYIDNAPDTQRRRGVASTSRLAW